jgi:hypothetical protein
MTSVLNFLEGFFLNGENESGGGGNFIWWERGAEVGGKGGVRGRLRRIFFLGKTFFWSLRKTTGEKDGI